MNAGASQRGAGSEELMPLEPLPQKDGPTPVVAIQYEPEHEHTLGCFRTVLAANELSERALRLTEEVIGINSAHYTAWEWRWRCVDALGGDALQRERAFIQRVAAANPKNYQLWNHRRRVALRLGLQHAPEELAFAGRCLAGDAKNYHAWSHRQAMVAAGGLWRAELEAAEALLQEDPSNNSAWNQRFFAASHIASQDPADLYASELPFVLSSIAKGPHNQSAWNYLRGLVALQPDRHVLAYDPLLSRLCIKVLTEDPSCSPALGMLSDIYADQAAIATAQQDLTAAGEAIKHGMSMMRRLRTADPIRINYWDHRAQQLQGILASAA